MKSFINFLFTAILILNLIFIISAEEDNSMTCLENDEQNIFEYYYSLEDRSLFLYNIVDNALTNLLTTDIKNTLVDSTILKTFLKNLSNNYNANTANGKNPYHNFFHAADVVQNLYQLLKKIKDSYGIFDVTEEYKNLDIFTLIIAAAAHDFKHPGRTNSFYRQNIEVPLYNELKEFNGQLESYHIQESIKLINSNDENNILSKLDESQKNRFYLVFNNSINSTDNAFNGEKAEFLEKYKDVIKAKTVDKVKKKLDKLSDNNLDIDEVKIIVLGILLHAVDISNPTKDYDLFIVWSVKVSAESCNQYNDEVKYKFTKFTSCNKNETEFYAGEKYFLENIIKVFYDPFCNAFSVLEDLCTNVDSNLDSVLKLL